MYSNQAIKSSNSMPVLMQDDQYHHPIQNQAVQQTSLTPMQALFDKCLQKHKKKRWLQQMTGDESEPRSSKRLCTSTVTSTNTSTNSSTSRRYPCRARGLSSQHNQATAFIDIPLNAPHGMLLSCSESVCAASGRRFRYCQVCAVPVAKRNFIKRHAHGLVSSIKELKVDDDEFVCGFVDGASPLESMFFHAAGGEGLDRLFQQSRALGATTATMAATARSKPKQCQPSSTTAVAESGDDDIQNEIASNLWASTRMGADGERVTCPPPLHEERGGDCLDKILAYALSAPRSHVHHSKLKQAAASAAPPLSSSKEEVAEFAAGMEECDFSTIFDDWDDEPVNQIVDLRQGGTFTHDR